MTMEKEGYICPHCRILFALPKSLGGNGAHCPGCDKLLTIPSVEDGVLPQGISKVSYQQAGLSSLEIARNEITKEGQWNTQRRREISRLENEDKALRWMLPMGITAVLMLVGLVFLLFRTGDDPTEKPDFVDRSFSSDGQEEGVSEVIFDHQNLSDKKKLRDFLDQVYEAETVDELITHCRDVSNLREKMEKFYHGEKLEPKKIRQLKNSFNFSRRIGFIMFFAETTQFEVVQGVVEYKDGNFKLDWESYIAYSEMTWKELKRLKPTDPVVLRLTVKEANYYNNEFKDERKWQSVKLTNPNEKEELLYGYVRKGSAVEQQVTNFGMSKDGYSVTVKAHFLEGATSDNQIIISEVVRDSWIGE